MIKDFDNTRILHFCGADFVVKFDGQACGFLEKFYFNEKDKTIKIASSVWSPLVNTVKEYEPDIEFRKLKNVKVEQIFCNEDGLKAYRVFKGVTFLGTEGEIDVDTHAPNTKYIYEDNYHFSFSSVSPLYILPNTISINEMPEAIDAYLKEKEETRYKEIKQKEIENINDSIEYLKKQKKELEKDE